MATISRIAVGVGADLSDLQKSLGQVGQIASAAMGNASRSLSGSLSGVRKDLIPALSDAQKGLREAGMSAKATAAALNEVGRYVQATGGGAKQLTAVTTELANIKREGKVTTESMQALVKQGIPAWEMLAQKIGTDVPTAMALVKQGSVNAYDGMKALTGAMNQFANETEKRFGSLNATVFKKLQVSITELGGKMSAAGSALTRNITLPMSAAGAGIMALANKTAAYAEQLDNMRQSTGLSYEQLQVLKFAADNAGLSFETVANASAMVQQKLMDVENGTSGAAKTLAALGISAVGTDGQLRPMAELFPQIIAALQGMTNTTERNMFASQLFGKSWKELAPILGMSAAEFANVEAQARALGLVLSDDSVNAALEFDNAMDNIKNAFSGLVMQLSTKVIPLMQEHLFPFIENTLIPALGSLITTIGNLANWFSNLSKPMQTLVLVLGGLVIGIGPVLSGLGQMATGISGLIGFVGNAAKFIPGAFGLIATAARFMWVAITGPVGLVIAAIAAVIGIGFLLAKNWDKVRYYGLQAWSLLKEGVLRAVSAILRYYEATMGLIPGIGKVIKRANEVLSDAIAKEQETRADRATEYAIEQEEKKAKAAAEAAKKAASGVAKEAVTIPTTYGPPSSAGENDKAAKPERLDAMQELDKELAAIATEEKLRGEFFDETAAKKSALQRALNRLIEEGVGAEDARVKKLAAQLNTLDTAEKTEKERIADAKEAAREQARAAKTVQTTREKATESVVRTEKQGADDSAKAWGDAAKQAAESRKKAWDDEKSRALEAANSYLMFNTDYVKGVEAGLKQAEERMASAGIFEPIVNGMRQAGSAIRNVVQGPSAVTMPAGIQSVGNTERAIAQASTGESGGGILGIIKIGVDKDGNLKPFVDSRVDTKLGQLMLQVEMGA